jgi:hypothetical protein
VSRLFSIIVTLFILVLVYLWIGHINGREDADNPPPVTPVRTGIQPETSIYLTGEDKDDQMTDTKVVEEPVEEDEEDVVNTLGSEEGPTEIAPVSDKPRGDHLVIVGNFLERANAEKHLSTVKDLGYPDAEILQFEISQYYTVCAARYNNPTDARRIAKKIKEQHGIDAYMRSVN